MSNYYFTTNCGSKSCYNIVLAIIGALLTFVSGLIIGAVMFVVVLCTLPVFIAIAVILIVLFVLFLILRRCSTARPNGC